MAFKAQMRVVINAVTIETISDTIHILNKYDFSSVDVTELSVSKTKKAKDYHILQGQNPVFIVAFTIGEENECTKD